MKEHHGLAKQFICIIALAALESVLLLTVSQVVLAKGLRFWFSRTEVQQHATQKQVQELQSYVTEHHLASTDVKELTDWSHKRRYTLLELYRGQTMIYSSFAPKDGMISFLPQNGTSDQNPGVLVDKTGFYDWLPCYTLTFADGEVSAMLYYNGFNTYYGTGCEILLSLCILWWFPSLFLLHCRRIVRYVVQLSEEIQAMEGGDLDHPITIRGSDEITTLASCLDSMRVTLRQQQEEEAQASAKVKNLITEMSHDLRTPLTTLLLYTEILRCRKYETRRVLGRADPVMTPYESGLAAALAFLQDGPRFREAENGVVYLAHCAARTGTYLSRAAHIPAGQPLAYLIAPPVPALLGLDAALKAAGVELAEFYAPPTETNYAGALLTGTRSACLAACIAFAGAVCEAAARPLEAEGTRRNDHGI